MISCVHIWRSVCWVSQCSQCASVKLLNLMGTVEVHTVHIKKSVQSQVHTSLSPVTEAAIKRRIYGSVNHVTHSATARAAQVFCPPRPAANLFPLQRLVNQIAAVLKWYFNSKLFFLLFCVYLGSSEHWRQLPNHLLYHLNVSDLMSHSPHLPIHIHTHATSNFTLNSLLRVIHPSLDG